MDFKTGKYHGSVEKNVSVTMKAKGSTDYRLKLEDMYISVFLLLLRKSFCCLLCPIFLLILYWDSQYKESGIKGKG